MPTVQEEKLKKLEDLFKMVNESVTQKEFISLAKSLVDIVSKIEKRNTKAVENLEKLFAEETTRFVEANSGIKVERRKIEAIKGLEKEFNTTAKQLKNFTNSDLLNLKNEIKEALGKAHKEQSNTMNFLRDKVRSLKDGKDGADGKDGKDGLEGKTPEVPKVEPPN